MKINIFTLFIIITISIQIITIDISELVGDAINIAKNKG